MARAMAGLETLSRRHNDYLLILIRNQAGAE